MLVIICYYWARFSRLWLL